MILLTTTSSDDCQLGFHSLVKVCHDPFAVHHHWQYFCSLIIMRLSFKVEYFLSELQASGRKQLLVQYACHGILATLSAYHIVVYRHTPEDQEIGFNAPYRAGSRL